MIVFVFFQLNMYIPMYKMIQSNPALATMVKVRWKGGKSLNISETLRSWHWRRVSLWWIRDWRSLTWLYLLLRRTHQQTEVAYSIHCWIKLVTFQTWPTMPPMQQSSAPKLSVRVTTTSSWPTSWPGPKIPPSELLWNGKRKCYRLECLVTRPLWT